MLFLENIKSLLINFINSLNNYIYSQYLLIKLQINNLKFYKLILLLYYGYDLILKYKEIIYILILQIILMILFLLLINEINLIENYLNILNYKEKSNIFIILYLYFLIYLYLRHRLKFYKIFFFKIILFSIFCSTKQIYCDNPFNKALCDLTTKVGLSLGYNQKTTLNSLETIGTLTIIGGTIGLTAYGSYKLYHHLNPKPPVKPDLTNDQLLELILKSQNTQTNIMNKLQQENLKVIAQNNIDLSLAIGLKIESDCKHVSDIVQTKIIESQESIESKINNMDQKIINNDNIKEIILKNLDEQAKHIQDNINNLKIAISKSSIIEDGQNPDEIKNLLVDTIQKLEENKNQVLDVKKHITPDTKINYTQEQLLNSLNKPINFNSPFPVLRSYNSSLKDTLNKKLNEIVPESKNINLSEQNFKTETNLIQIPNQDNIVIFNTDKQYLVQKAVDGIIFKEVGLNGSVKGLTNIISSTASVISGLVNLDGIKAIVLNSLKGVLQEYISGTVTGATLHGLKILLSSSILVIQKKDEISSKPTPIQPDLTKSQLLGKSVGELLRSFYDALSK